VQNLKDALLLQEKPMETSEKYWNKMNKIVCGAIRSYLTNIKYHIKNETSARKMGDL